MANVVVDKAPEAIKWNCQIQDIGADGKPAALAADTDMTIGKKLFLSCDGPLANLKRETLQIENPKATPFALHLVQVQTLTETRAELIVTPWMSGQVKLKNLVLTDGTTRVGLNDMALNISSVITPENNPEHKPVPPMSVMGLAWPLYVWAILIGILGLIAVAIGLVIRRRMQKTRFLKELQRHSVAMTPYNHFNKELRKLSREASGSGKNTAWTPEQSTVFFAELESAFRWYIARELVVPAVQMSPSRIVREIAKTDKELFTKIRRDLLIALREIRKLKLSRNPGNAEDALQLVELTRTLADAIYKSVEAAKKKGRS